VKSLRQAGGGLGWATGVLSWFVGAAFAAAPPPNIVLILADDVGREAVGCYGGTSYPTPHLDRLAAEGVRFDHFYSAPVCHPTRIMLMTGRYPVHWGRPKWGTFPKAAEARAIARQLQRAGYATAAAGKWQLTKLGQDLDHPHRLGFDTYCLFGWHEGPRYYDPFVWQDGRRLEGTEGRYGPDIYTEFLIDFIRRHQRRPFFAFYSMALCHAVSDDFNPRPPYGPRGRYDTFAEMMAAMDERVGRLVAAMYRLGLKERTLIFFAADNGSPRSNFIRRRGKGFESEQVISEFRGRKAPGGKGRITDWGIRVPAIARRPGSLPAGSVSEGLHDMTDLLPTFCELAGAPLPPELDGRSFADFLRGGSKKDPGRPWIFSESQGQSCIRSRRWKLASRGQLFQVGDDPFAERLIPPEEDTAESAAARRHWRRQLDLLLGRR